MFVCFSRNARLLSINFLFTFLLKFRISLLVFLVYDLYQLVYVKFDCIYLYSPGVYFQNTATGFQCSCPQNFHGDICQEQTNYCREDTCYNGGTCQDQEGSYTCICRPGFEGFHCERETGGCKEDTCQNGKQNSVFTHWELITHFWNEFLSFSSTSGCVTGTHRCIKITRLLGILSLWFKRPSCLFEIKDQSIQYVKEKKC